MQAERIFISGDTAAPARIHSLSKSFVARLALCATAPGRATSKSTVYISMSKRGIGIVCSGRLGAGMSGFGRVAAGAAGTCSFRVVRAFRETTLGAESGDAFSPGIVFARAGGNRPDEQDQAPSLSLIHI